MSGKVAVKLENVTKRFEDVIAVNNVSLEVYGGELFTLLGPSGCGKTTTLRIIAGLEFPDEGKVYIDGVDVTGKPAREREVCLVFQEYAVFPHMSVFDNIAFGLKVKKLPRAEIERKVKEVAEMLDLTDYLKYKGGRLGLSEQQKVAIARCVAVEPKLLLLDEPLTLADAKIREKMRRELRKLQKDLGVTMIFVTHDQLEALMLSDRIAVMRSGRLIQLGTPEEVYDNPEDIFVATFVGSPTINLLEGVLEIERGKLLLRSGANRYVVSDSFDATRVADLVNSEVVLGFRPEDAEIRDDGVLEGVVKLAEIAEDRKILYVKINEHDVKIFTELFAPYDEGQKVKIRVNPVKLHIFDKKTGRKILRGVGGV
ncbi:MAG: ABC transporter ATP-binding protein [Thermosphaera sp.]